MKKLMKEIFIGFLFGTGFTSFFYDATFYGLIAVTLGFVALASMVEFEKEEAHNND